MVKTFDAHGYALHYAVAIGRDGFPSRVEVSVAGGGRMSLLRNVEGVWTDNAGQEQLALRGATDVDISATPFTNSLPLRRLKLAVGQQAEIQAVRIGVPGLDVHAVPQRYTRLSEHTYRYENLLSGYKNEITLDSRGLVARYPGAFEQLEVLND